MSSNDEILEKIELYSKGQMSLQERIAFEKEIDSNEQLQKKIELSLIADELVIAQEALKLKEQMRKDLNKSKPDWNKYILITLLGVGSAFWLYHKGNTDEDKVLSKEYTSQEKRTISEENKDVESSTHAINNKDNYSVSKKTSPSEPALNSEALDTATEKILSKETQQQFYLQEVPKETSLIKDNSDNTTISKSMPENDPCATLQGNIKYAITPACKGEETGEIQIYPESVKGGTAPYTFLLDERQTVSRFDNLSPGHYDLKIKDARNCIVECTQKIFVPEKICKTPKAYVFNPEYDRAWVIPYDRDKAALRITIVEKSGKVYYKSQVNNSEPSEWTGESNMGLSLGIGLYFFTIEYTDGSSDEGTVTVTK